MTYGVFHTWKADSSETIQQLLLHIHKKKSAVETWVRESQEANHTGTGCTIKAPTAGLRP